MSTLVVPVRHSPFGTLTPMTARQLNGTRVGIAYSSIAALGADDGNRTRISCLGSKRSTTELHRRDVRGRHRETSQSRAHRSYGVDGVGTAGTSKDPSCR